MHEIKERLMELLHSTAPAPPLHSIFTSSLVDLFAQFGISLIVSTYQAGKVILVRLDGGLPTGDAGPPRAAINTHFRAFHKPMGLAIRDQCLAIGGAQAVWELRDMPAVAGKLEPSGKHDACYLPRRIHIT